MPAGQKYDVVPQGTTPPGSPLSSDSAMAAEDDALRTPLNWQQPHSSRNLATSSRVLLATAMAMGCAAAFWGVTRWSGSVSLAVADVSSQIEEIMITTGLCAQIGCGGEYNPTSDCQCTPGCMSHGNCCKDYGQICPAAPVPQEAVQQAPPGSIPGTSLYCFVLMMPAGYEVGLVQFMAQQHASLFGCEEYQVFSNVSVPLGPGINSYPMGGSLAVPYKDIYALNTDVFIRVWKTVKSLGSYRNHDWSIKVDIDCVFFPDRFRGFVARTSTAEIPGPLIPQGPVWLNNCQYGMHGPIEVVSRDGMTMFLDGMDAGCENVRQAAMDNTIPDTEHGFGEDMYARRCLKQLNVQQVDEYETLLSERWNCIERPKDCGGKKIAFHAWKSVADWQNCLNFAQNSADWPQASSLPAASSVPPAQPATPVAPPSAQQQQGQQPAMPMQPVPGPQGPMGPPGPGGYNPQGMQGPHPAWMHPPQQQSPLDRLKSGLSNLLHR